MGVERFGLQGCRKNLSALHTEMEGLIWAMSCLREFHCTAIHMETDCPDLVEMLDSPADWPTFASELVSFRLLKDSFLDFSISRILRTRNLHANSLVKEARISGTLFPYRSDPVGQSVSSERLKLDHLISEDGNRQKKMNIMPQIS